MANNAKVTLTFDVQEDGSLKLVTKNLNELNKATQTNSKVARDAGKANEELTYKLNQGSTGVSSAARSFSKLNQAIGSGPNGLVGAYATLAANAFAVSAAFNTLREAAQVEQLMRGLEVQGERTGRTLTVTAKALQDATNNAISAADAMRTAAQGAASGISSLDLNKLTKGATDAAVALGRNVPDALDRVIKGVTKLEPELLDELGVMTKLDEATRAYAQTIGKAPSALSNMEKRQGYLVAVSGELERKFKGISEEAGVNVYDQLGAAFSNLTKDVLNTINGFTPLIEVLKYLSESSLGLGAILVMFAGTVSKQVLPSLYQMGENAQKSASALAELGKQKLNNVRAAQAQAKADNEAAVNQLKQFTLIEKNTKLFKEYVDDLNKGTASTSQYNKALRSLTGQIGYYNKIAGESPTTKKEKDAKQLSEIFEQQKNQLLKLKDTDDIQAAAVLRNRAIVKAAKLEAIAVSRLEAAATAESSMLQSAGNLKVTTTYGFLKKSVIDYVAALKLKQAAEASDSTRASTNAFWKLGDAIGSATSKLVAFVKSPVASIATGFNSITGAIASAGGMLNFLKGGFRGVTLAVKAFGTAFAAAIPVIGEILLLIDLLIEFGPKIWNYLTGKKENEALKSALEENEEILKRTEKTAIRLNKVFGNSAASAAETGDALRALSNSVNEIADSFVKVQQAKDAPEALAKGLQEVVKEQNKLGNLKGLNISGVKDSEEFKALAALYSTGYENIQKDIVNATLATETFKKANDETKLQMMSKAILDLQAKYGKLTPTLDAVRDAYRELEKASVEFGLSLAKSTPYDNMVSGISKVVGAIGDLRTQYKMGALSAKDYAAQITQIGESSVNVLDSGTQERVNTLKNTEAQLAVSQKLFESNKQDKTLQQEVSNLSAQRNKQTEELAPLLETAVLKAQAQFEALQSQDRTLQSIMKLEDARNKRINTYLGKTKQAAQLQDEQADKMRNTEAKRIDLQIQQLKNQRAAIEFQQITLKNQDDLNKKKLASLKIDLQALEAQKVEADRRKYTIDTSISKNSREWAERYRREIIDPNRPDKIRFVDTQAEEEFKTAEAGIKRITTTIEELTRSVSVSESSSEALRMQLKGVNDSITAASSDKAALFADKLSAAERAARDLGLDMDIVMGFLQEVGTQQSIIVNLREQELKLTSSISQTILTQLRISELQLKANREALNLESKQQAQTLINRRESLKVAISTGNYQGKSLQMLQAELKLTEATLLQLQQTYRLKDAELLVAFRLQLVEQARFDTLNEGIQMQQKALQIVEQEAKIREDLLSTEQQIRVARTQIAYARQGLEVPEEITKLNDYKVAKEAYDIFQQNLAIRIKGIELEYALLEAQRVQTVLELSYKKKILDLELQRAQREAGSDPIKLKAIAEERTMLAQLDSALATITKTTYEGNKQLAIEALNAEGRLKAANVELTRLKLVGGIGVDQQVGQIFAAIETMRTVFNEAPKALNSVGDVLFTQVEDSTKAIIPDLGSILSDNLSELDKKFSGVSDLGSIFKISTEALITELDKLNGSIDTLLEKVVGKAAMDTLRSSRSQATVSTDTSLSTRQQRALEAFNYGSAQGFRVDELKGQTSVGKHEGIRGAGEVGHYVGTAFDVNIGKGNKEWENPAQKKRMDELAAYYRSIGATVLWGVKDHYDHMHVEFMRSTQATTESAVTRVADTAVRTTETAGITLGEEAKNLIGGLPSSTVTAQTQSTPTTGAPMPAANDNTRSGLNIDVAKTSENFAKSYIANTFGTKEQISTFTEEAKSKVSELNSNLVTEATTIGNKLREELFSSPLSPEAYQKALEEFKRRFTEAVSYTANEMRSKAFPAADLADKVSGFWENATPLMQPFMEGLKKLGPQGELVAAAFGGIQSLSIAVTQFAKDVETGGLSLENMASLASTALNVIQSVTQASANAKVAAIDKEIAAEQKRDGKSKESLAKIDAMEKRKDQIARKQFNTNKKISMAQAVIATATGVAEALKYGPIAGPILAGMIGAMGLAQLAIISGTQYESSYTPKAVEMPTSLSIGKRDTGVNLAMGPNANAGGEVGYLRGAAGTGTSASNYNAIGSAYGGDLSRGYGNRGFIVGEKGPELITPETPINVTPANENVASAPVNATINIQAIDSQGVQDVLVAQKGNIIQMLRQAANANGQRFLEDVNVNVYTRPSVGKLL